MLKIIGEKLILTLPQVEYEIEERDNLLYARTLRGSYRCHCRGERFPHRVGAYHRVLNGWALDVNFKCRDCHIFVIHGIPCEEDERLKKFAGKFIINEDEEIKRRLKELGCW